MHGLTEQSLADDIVRWINKSLKTREFHNNITENNRCEWSYNIMFKESNYEPLLVIDRNHVTRMTVWGKTARTEVTLSVNEPKENSVDDRPIYKPEIKPLPTNFICANRAE